jgi:glucokinase
VDLGGTNLRIVAVAEAGKMLEKVTLSTEVAKGREVVVEDLVRAIGEVREKCKGRGELRGIGAGVPGLIDAETGRVVKSPNLPGWEEFDVKGDIERQLGATVILENDANVAALGEQWLGAGKGTESLCMYTLGTGVGGGLIFDGKLWRGWNGMAAELGHCNVEPEGHECPCGSRGCLEQYASATAVVRMAKEALSMRAPSQMRDGKELTSLKVYECAMQGDAVARQVFERVGRALGRAIADMINAINPPLFVIGGGAASAWEAFAPSMMDEVRKRSYIYAFTVGADGKGMRGRTRVTRIVKAELADAGLIGAARLAMI